MDPATVGAPDGPDAAAEPRQAQQPLPTRRSLRSTGDVSHADVTPADVTPADVTPVGATPADATPVDATPVDITPADATPADVNPVDLSPVDATPAPTVETVDVPGPLNGHLDAVIDTDGRGFPALSGTSRLDWLSSDTDPAVETGSTRPGVGAWLRTVRTSAAGVDLRSTATRRVLPQVGVIAVMAAATMGNVMAGQVSPTASAIGGASTDFARAQIAILPGVDEGTPVISDLDNSGDLVAGEDGVLRVRGAEDASRGGTRDALPGCDGVPPEVPITNGDVPEEYLCLLPDGTEKLRADAAEAFALLNEAYAAEIGDDICVSSGYRSYAAQAALRRQKPSLAARAGSSQHGEGLAVDLCGGIEDESNGYWWLRENAPAFGFDNPDWARRGGSKYEPWHWEYVAGRW